TAGYMIPAANCHRILSNINTRGEHVGLGGSARCHRVARRGPSATHVSPGGNDGAGIVAVPRYTNGLVLADAKAGPDVEVVIEGKERKAGQGKRVVAGRQIEGGGAEPFDFLKAQVVAVDVNARDVSAEPLVDLLDMIADQQATSVLCDGHRGFDVLRIGRC